MDNKSDTKYIVKLKDSRLINAYSDEERIPGYSVNDYVPQCFNYLYLKLLNVVIKVIITNEYIFGLNFSEIIKLFAKDFSNMTEIEFAKYLSCNLRDICKGEIKFMCTNIITKYNNLCK